MFSDVGENIMMVCASPVLESKKDNAKISSNLALPTSILDTLTTLVEI